MINYLKKNSSYLIKFLTWMLVFLTVLEIFIQSFVIKLPFQHFVSGLGYVPVDNAVTVWGVEGYGITHYLSYGEISTPYSGPGTSVLVLGDSYTEALQVHDDQKFVSVAERILHERGVNMDLHNLGASGRSLADYVYIAPFVIKEFSPDIIVVQLSGNDFDESLDPSRENYFVISETSIELAHNEDHFLVNQDLRNLIRLSGISTLARYKLSPIIQEQRERLASGDDREHGDSEILFSDLKPHEMEMQISALRDAYPDAELVFLVIPRLPFVQGNEFVWESIDDDFVVNTMKSFLDEPILYPREVFFELYIGKTKFSRGFTNTLPNSGHLNSDGNFAIGLALADYLESITK